jgi:hypothetical protein
MNTGLVQPQDRRNHKTSFITGPVLSQDLYYYRISMIKELVFLHDRTSMITGRVWSNDVYDYRTGIITKPVWLQDQYYYRISVIKELVFLHDRTNMITGPLWSNDVYDYRTSLITEPIRSQNRCVSGLVWLQYDHRTYTIKGPATVYSNRKTGYDINT